MEDLTPVGSDPGWSLRAGRRDTEDLTPVSLGRRSSSLDVPSPGCCRAELTTGVGRMEIGTSGEPVSHIAQAYPDRVEVRGRDL